MNGQCPQQGSRRGRLGNEYRPGVHEQETLSPSGGHGMVTQIFVGNAPRQSY
jgi:hypothetical protein